jgi:hypothetical protein
MYQRIKKKTTKAIEMIRPEKGARTEIGSKGLFLIGEW